MRIRFLEIARIELDEGIQYYNQEARGLGETFLTEVLKAVNRIGKFPEAWHPYSKRTRRCQIRRFPYAVVYQIREDEILVVAVAHLHRTPGYWKDRIGNEPHKENSSDL
jgi:toxin ParE2